MSLNPIQVLALVASGFEASFGPFAVPLLIVAFFAVAGLIAAAGIAVAMFYGLDPR